MGESSRGEWRSPSASRSRLGVFELKLLAFLGTFVGRDRGLVYYLNRCLPRELTTGYDGPQPTGDAMKRRSRAVGEPNKTRRRKTPEPNRRNKPKTLARSISSSSGNETEVVRLTRELNEAREQQSATSEILRIISNT